MARMAALLFRQLSARGCGPRLCTTAAGAQARRLLCSTPTRRQLSTVVSTAGASATTATAATPGAAAAHSQQRIHCGRRVVPPHRRVLARPRRLLATVRVVGSATTHQRVWATLHRAMPDDRRRFPSLAPRAWSVTLVPLRQRLKFHYPVIRAFYYRRLGSSPPAQLAARGKDRPPRGPDMSDGWLRYARRRRHDRCTPPSALRDRQRAYRTNLSYAYRVHAIGPTSLVYTRDHPKPIHSQ